MTSIPVLDDDGEIEEVEVDDTVDRQRIHDDVRTLICEGACNPDIHDYDAACRAYRESLLHSTRYVGKITLRTITEWAKRLKYAAHVRVRPQFWHSRHGWTRSFRCTRCGHVRNC